MGYKYRVVEIGEYVLIIQREKNICFKMKKKEFEEEGHKDSGNYRWNFKNAKEI